MIRSLLYLYIIISFSCISHWNFAQSLSVSIYDELNSHAIHMDSSIVIDWASSCEIFRGYINISDTSQIYNGSNKASFGEPSDAIGKADNKVVSLGDGGIALLYFDNPISNGDGPDFAVFENGFRAQQPPYLYFLEFAFVEVSSDGHNFVRFPSESYAQTDTQISTFDQLDPLNVNNLAGKHEAGYGTPFDLNVLADSSKIDIDNIHYMRIVDVVGAVQDLYATYDSKGTIINDPWPTPFNTGGFDLDAIGVIHNNVSISTGLSVTLCRYPVVYPNPVRTGQPVVLYVPSSSSEKMIQICAYTVAGKLVYHNWFDISDKKTAILPAFIYPGGYILRFTSEKNIHTIRKIIVM